MLLEALSDHQIDNFNNYVANAIAASMQIIGSITFAKE
jgi:hypothetical protein